MAVSANSSSCVFAALLLVLLLAAAGSKALDPCPKPSTTYTYEAGLPDGCLSDPKKDCEYYLSMGPNTNNDDFIDIHLEGTLDGGIGWVAVGFSKDKLMFDDDVNGCLRSDDGQVHIIDAWNPSTHHQPNQRDPNQDGICPYDTNYINGRINCSFSRYYGIVNVGFDWNLRNGPYYLFWGRSQYTGMGNESFLFHFPNHPVISDSPMSPYSDNNSNGTGSAGVNKRPYEQAHGILMIFSYVLLAGTGIFFSSWMKPVMPGGMWFQIHRCLMVLSLVTASAGFMTIFIGMRDNDIKGLLSFECTKEVVHFTFGIILFALHLFNPLLALIRPKPDAPERIWFNVIHGYAVGYFTKILAFINIGLGLILFQSPHCGMVDIKGSSGDYLFVYHLLYVVFIVVWEVVLYVVFTYFTMKAPYNMRSIMAPSLLRPFFRYIDKGYQAIPDIQQGNNGGLCDKSPAYILRWISFGVFFTVTVAITLLNMSFIIADKQPI